MKTKSVLNIIFTNSTKLCLKVFKPVFMMLVAIIGISSCSGDKQINNVKKSHPSHVYTYIDVETANFGYRESVYVPVYSDIYDRDGTKRTMLTTTISIRNNSLIDSAYVLSAIYFDSYGKRLKDYIDSAILLSPLESIEFVVEEVEDLGGAGANFIVDWVASNYSDQLLIQSVMIGTYGQQGVSFLSESKVIEKINRKTRLKQGSNGSK